MDIQAALRDGYSKDEVMAELGKRTGMNYQQALQDGYSADEVLIEMNKRESKAPPAEKPGFWSRTGTNLGKAFTEATTPIEGTGVLADTIPRVGEKVLRTAGHLGAVAGDAMMEGAKGIYNTFTSPASRETIRDAGAWLANTDIGKAQLQTIKGITDTYGQAKGKYPRLMADVEAGANALNLIPAAQLVKAGMPGAKAVLSNVGKQTEATLTKKIDTAIQAGIEKAVRPSVVGKRTAAQAKNYYDRAKTAVEKIIENKDNLALLDVNGNPARGLPQTLKQFSKAIEQTKRSVYQQYHDMAVGAGESGAAFDAGKVLESLDGVSADLKHNPEIRQYASGLKDQIAELHGQPPDVIEARIADLNSSLSGFYEGRVSRAKAQVDASVANLMREELDNNILNAVGPGYQDLKNTYGSLKSLEKEVAHRSIVNARKNIKGIADLTDIFTKGEIVTGILTANPALVARGTAGLGIKAWIKSINNPDRIVKGMFGDVEKLIEKRAAVSASRTAPADARTGIPTGAAWFNADGLQTETGLGPVKSGVTSGQPYGPEPARLIRPKQLPAGQEFRPGSAAPQKSSTLTNAEEPATIPPVVKEPGTANIPPETTPKAVGGIEAYHGTPHVFLEDKFDLKEIGSGEGAQAFGYGLYFTDNPDIGRLYAKKSLTYAEKQKSRLTINDKTLEEYGITSSEAKEWEKRVVADAARMETGYEWKAAKDSISAMEWHAIKEGIPESKLLAELKEKLPQNPSFDLSARGSLKKVILHTGKDETTINWLEWYEPITAEQARTIEKQATMANIKIPDISEYTGEDLYHIISEKLGSDKKASSFLAKAKIDGIRYPAYSKSEGGGYGESGWNNYVVFSEKAVKLKGDDTFRLPNPSRPPEVGGRLVAPSTKVTPDEWIREKVATLERAGYTGERLERVIDGNSSALVQQAYREGIISPTRPEETQLKELAKIIESITGKPITLPKIKTIKTTDGVRLVMPDTIKDFKGGLK